jgi:hypothetical protein
MGKASRRKRQQRNGSHRDRVQAAGRAIAPNFEGATVEAIRHALAMVTAVQASPEDLPGLIEDLAADRARQGLVAYALVSQLIMENARELADARGMTMMATLDDATADLQAGEAENRTALDRALSTARNYGEVLDGIRPPETVAANLDANLEHGQAAVSYLIALTQIAREVIRARCAEIGEDVISYLQRISLPAAEIHGNEIEANAVDDYVGALIAERLATEPLLLAHAAEALRRGTAALPDEDAGEFRELGGSDRLEEVAGDTWDDLDAEDQRLLAITLLECVLVDPEGETVADRLSVTWRF